MYVLFILYFIYLVFTPFIKYLLSIVAPALLLKDVQVFENLEPYFESLNSLDSNWTIKEELYGLKNLGMQTMDTPTLDCFIQSKSSPKLPILGIHTYDMLRNPYYIEAF